MENNQPKGLLAIWADIEKSYTYEFRKWHSCQHVAERVNTPGFISGYRYCGFEYSHDYFMFYETTDSKVLGSASYQHSVNNPSPWTKESLTHFRNAVRNIYNEIYTIGEKPRIVSPYLYVSRFDLENGNSEEALIDYKKMYLESLMAHPEITRARIFKSDLSLSEIESDEKMLHKAGPAVQPFLTLIEISCTDKITDEKWKTYEPAGSFLNRLKTRTQERYWLDYMMAARTGVS